MLFMQKCYCCWVWMSSIPVPSPVWLKWLADSLWTKKPEFWSFFPLSALFHLGKFLVVIKGLSSFKVLHLSGLVLVLGCAGTAETDPWAGWRVASGLCHQQQMSCWDTGILWDGPEVLTCSPRRKLWWGSVLAPVGWWNPTEMCWSSPAIPPQLVTQWWM